MLGKIKWCPVCHKEFNKENIYCPHDGSPLQYKEIENVCVKCDKQYENTYKFCPVHGDQLTNVIPSYKNELNEKYQDLFKRSVCPKCDAYNNWEIHENIYTCKSCNGKFQYTNGKAFIIDGDLINHVLGESIESSPYYNILTTIDKSNSGYWLDLFKKFDETGIYRKWNWPSFFFDIFRYFWKGLWKKGLIIYGIVIFISGVTGYFSGVTGEPIFDKLWPIMILGVKLFLGSNGSEDYYKFVKELGVDVKKAEKQVLIGRILLVVMIVFSISFKFIFSK